MAKGVPILGKDPLGKAKYANVTESGDLRVQLSGNDVVIGLLADRPPASEMRGRGYYAWDETDGHKLKYSDGTNWVVNQ
jgi:hypothetical protein